MKSKHIKKSGFSIVFKWALLVICAVLIGINYYYINANGLLRNKLPMPFGYGLSTVITGSMEPEIYAGDLIVVKKTKEIAEKDVVVFEQEGALVVHRVVEINGSKITTKGDANNTCDSPIHKSAIRGKVVKKLSHLGNVVLALKSPIGLVVMLAIAVLLLNIPYRNKPKTTDIEEIKQEISRIKSEINKD